MSNITTNTESTNSRKKKNHDKSGKLQRKRDRKRSEAKARQAAYDKVSIKEKMKYAGAKELAKLEKKLATKAVKTEKKVAVTA